MGTGKKIGIGIRLTVMAVCYFLAVHYSENVQDAARIVVVSLSDGATDEKAESICEEEELSLCFWNEQKDIRFSCRETGKSVQATGLLTKGNPELIVRGSGILTWLERGCVMDIATAQELFGTRQVNGQIVWCGGKAFTVYGIFESLDHTVVLRDGAGSVAGDSAEGISDAVWGTSSGETLYDHLSLRASQGASAKTDAEQLLMRCGLAGDIADFTFPGAVCGDLLLVLPALLALGLTKGLWVYLREERQEKSGTAKKKKQVFGIFACTVMASVVAAGLFFMLRDHLQIPADMIPTRWSDFSFWTQWWTGQKANLLRLLGGAQGEMQLEALWSFGRSVICDILAVGAGISLLHVGKKY